MSLQRALLALLGAVLLAAIVPAGIVIDRRLMQEVETRAHDDLARAPRLLGVHNMQIADAMRMHAKEIARAPRLADALRRRDRLAALREMNEARGGVGDVVVLSTATGELWSGPPPGPALIAATQRGETIVSVVSAGGLLHSIALAPIMIGGRWAGAGGVATKLDRPAAATLSALTRADVVIVGADGTISATSASDSTASHIATQLASLPRDTSVREIEVGGHRYLSAEAPLGDVATAIFVRDLAPELSIVPQFRRVIVFSGIGATLLGLCLGSIAALRLARPVQSLADAADRLAHGDVGAPLMPSSIREIQRLSHAFDAMRRTLANRLADVTAANRTLAEQQTRLNSAQSELLQRERLSVSGRMVAELSHEIRNPIANLRNCLEIIRRRVGADAESREFADLAIDELLRMHELAEQMLDLNRPRDPAVRACRADIVAREVAALTTVGFVKDDLRVEVLCEGELGTAIAPDALKQVLLNLVHNSREAITERPGTSDEAGRITLALRGESERVIIDVTDNGPGISDEVRARIFDPFFTTKGAVQGVGLGLFVAEGLIRSAGGRMTAVERPAGVGAQFRLELPAASVGVDGDRHRQEDDRAISAAAVIRNQ